MTLIPPISQRDVGRLSHALHKAKIQPDPWVNYEVDQLERLGTLKKLQVDCFKGQTS